MIRRNLFELLKSHLDKQEFTILTGARQTGKSTLLRQLESFCKESQVPSVFLNMENKNILLELNQSPLKIFTFLPETSKRVVVFIDEIQYLDDPSNFLKLLYDEHVRTIKIIATGSSAFYIDKKFKDSLVGRKRLFHLYTCSFDEYLRFRNREELIDDLQRIQTNSSAKSLHIELLQQEWNSYMVFGGYPAVIKELDQKEKIAYLKDIRDSFVKRDILESGVQNENAFYTLLRMMAGQTGSMVNVNELSIRLKIKNETVNNYLGSAEKSKILISLCSDCSQPHK